MKIVICGFCGSGKSTLAKRLGQLYNTKVLHIDTLHFYPGLIVRERELLEEDIKSFMDNNTEWVIDGNYYNHNPERFSEADLIIYLKFSRWTCLKRLIRRSCKEKGIQRDDMAEGCPNKLDMSFLMWALVGQRRKKITNGFKRYSDEYPEKVKVFKRQKDVDKYVEELANERETR